MIGLCDLPAHISQLRGECAPGTHPQGVWQRTTRVRCSVRDVWRTQEASPTALRGAAASAAAGALLLTAAPGAGAVTSHQPSLRQAESIRPTGADGGTAAGGAAASDAGPLGSYRGVQGGNLCLLARCTVGDSGPEGHAGPGNTQGFNLCLLAACTVRP